MTSPDIRAQFGVLLARAEQSLLAELRDSQVTHPVDEYQAGSPRLERLYQAMDEAQRYQWPSEVRINL